MISKNQYPIKITFRRTSRLSMRATKKGEIHVSAPLGMSQNTVNAFIDGHTAWMERVVVKMQAAVAAEIDFYGRLPLDSPQQRLQAEQQLSTIVTPLLENYSKQMKVKPGIIMYKKMKSRWGLCNCGSGKIEFSLYLLLLPEWCIKSIVVHELAHLRVPNHGSRFYALMDNYYPQWREARKYIKKVFS
ncbi:MAG: M48 family metallopeptidase [Bacteroidales bacterium]|jgi:predicted metal-dependent hydrolase|nr:M48 family metallopeptidase [Bacteroidales bacterium]